MVKKHISEQVETEQEKRAAPDEPPFSLRNYKKQRARLHTVVLFIDPFGENFSLIVKRAAVSSRPVQKGGMKKRVIF